MATPCTRNGKLPCLTIKPSAEASSDGGDDSEASWVRSSARLLAVDLRGECIVGESIKVEMVEFTVQVNRYKKWLATHD